MNKNERFEVRHDGRFVVDKLTDEIVVDDRTKKDIRSDWFDPNIDVRRGLEDSFPIEEGSETETFIDQHNAGMAEKDARIKHVLERQRELKAKGLSSGEIFLDSLREIRNQK